MRYWLRDALPSQQVKGVDAPVEIFTIAEWASVESQASSLSPS